MPITNEYASSEIVGWFATDLGDEAHQYLGSLGLEEYRGVFVAHRGDRGMAVLIDDAKGWNEDLPVDVEFERSGPIFTNRDYDNDFWHDRVWTHPDCEQVSVDLPWWTFDFEAAERAGGQQFSMVIRGLRLATQNRNRNPYADAPAPYKLTIVEVMYFRGAPPVNAASLYFKPAR